METKALIEKTIKAYSQYADLLKRVRPSKEEEAYIVGTIFGLKKGLELYDEEEIMKVVGEQKISTDPYEEGRTEGLVIVKRIMDNDQIVIDLLNNLFLQLDM